MPTLTEDEVRANLPDVIDALRPGEEVVVTRHGKPVARLVADPPSRPPRKAGNCVGLAVIVSDEDADLSEFAEHMQ